MSSGNGKAGTRREAFAHNEAARERALTEQEKALADLEGSEWADEITETQIIVQPGATVHVDQTGRHQAMAVTKPDNPRPTQESIPERVLDAAGDLTERVKTWKQVMILLGLIGLAAFAAWLRWGR